MGKAERKREDVGCGGVVKVGLIPTTPANGRSTPLLLGGDAGEVSTREVFRGPGVSGGPKAGFMGRAERIREDGGIADESAGDVGLVTVLFEHD
jgi:hypothetical protein